jgi:hypothetical protein
MVKRIVVELESEEHQAIKEKAVKQGKTIREIVRKFLKEWVKK